MIIPRDKLSGYGHDRETEVAMRRVQIFETCGHRMQTEISIQFQHVWGQPEEPQAEYMTMPGTDVADMAIGQAFGQALLNESREAVERAHDEFPA